ncbi:hypothetical protein [Spongiimicrobium salis]|uniref:hypothetical protein n=1 Tax=Spongiimicrobium salis TaxID=1667022 RepID=UPI00374C89B6
MSDFIKKYEIWIFLVLAPIINALFVYARTKGLVPGFVYTHGRFYILLFLLVCIVKYTRGTSGIKDMFRPMLKWNINPLWYLFGFLFAMTMGTLTLLLKGLYLDIEYSSLLKLNFAATSPRGSLVILIWAFLGEVVWVSYCLRELSKIMKPFYASQVVGFFWTLWWIPIVILGEGVIPDFPIWALLIGMLGTAGMCAVVYGQTKSGLCVWILQFMLNMSLILLPVSPRVGGVPTYITFAIIYFITMLAFMYFMNPIKKMKVVESNLS